MKKIIGKVSKNIAEKWYINDFIDKKIVFYDDRFEHCKEHINDYSNKNNFYHTYNNLNKIISNPDYVYYDVDKKGLEYYKKLDDNILVAVRIKTGNELKVKSFYPVEKSKIENRKKKEKNAIDKALIEKYKYKEPA